MEISKIKALLLAAAIVSPNLVALVAEDPIIKHAEEFSSEELRDTLRAYNCVTYTSEPAKEVSDEPS